MADKKPKGVLFRRRRKKKTDYAKRLKLLLSRKPRLVVRLTNKSIIAQIIQYGSQGDKVIAGLDSSSLRKIGWNYSCKNMPAAYLTGLMLSRKAQQNKVGEVILDTGFRTPQKQGRIYAFIKGVTDGGMKVPYGEGILPPEDKLLGKHIQHFAQTIKNQKVAQFAQAFKNNRSPEQIPATVEKLKKEILKNKEN